MFCTYSLTEGTTGNSWSILNISLFHTNPLSCSCSILMIAYVRGSIITSPGCQNDPLAEIRASGAGITWGSPSECMFLWVAAGGTVVPLLPPVHGGTVELYSFMCERQRFLVIHTAALIVLTLKSTVKRNLDLIRCVCFLLFHYCCVFDYLVVQDSAGL